MSSASYPTVTASKKSIQLDPRTKLLLLLTITTLMFSTSNEGIMNLIKPLLSLVPFILILSERRFQTAAKYLILYAACFALERVEKGTFLPNLMLSETRMLYPKEYAVGQLSLIHI